jgi:DNA repair protein RadC
VTKLLFEAGKVLGTQLLDHIVFTYEKFFSFRSNPTHPLGNMQQKGGR